MRFSPDVLDIDARAEADRISGRLREAVSRLRRRGVVVALSGGVDSACVAALSVRALGPDRVLGLILPERDSSPESARLAEELCARLGIERRRQDIAPVLEAVGCYAAREAAVRSVFPGFLPSMPWKIVLPGRRDRRDGINVLQLVVEVAAGDERRVRLPPEAALAIVAATNFKQRTRKMIEYHHADRRVFAVAGTPNRLEYDQGFFVKLGDGAADVKPIAHLYKTQVYAVAREAGVPDAILRRPPTTDTYSLSQSQEDFFFQLPYHELDLLLWARDHAVSAAEAASALGRTEREVERVYADIDQKRRVAEYLHAPPVVLE